MMSKQRLVAEDALRVRGRTMLRSPKPWVLVMVIAIGLLIAICLWPRREIPTAGAVNIAFLGYTNAPNNNSRFALFSITNRAAYTIRWHDDWVEVEGNAQHKAKVINPALPECKRAPVLKARGNLILAVGIPLEAMESGRWKYCAAFSCYSLEERWLDFSFRHKLPLALGPIKLVDAQRIWNPTNRVTVSSEWLKN